jgi:hypothetical protein
MHSGFGQSIESGTWRTPKCGSAIALQRCAGDLQGCKYPNPRDRKKWEVRSEKWMWLLLYGSDHGKSWIKLFVWCAGRKHRKHLATDTASAVDADAELIFIFIFNYIFY